jgi:penicillin G amidase
MSASQRMRTTAGSLYGALRLAAQVLKGARAILRASPLSVEERLANLPLSGAPVAAPVAVHWDSRQLFFIDASSDADLAVALGVVHAHLRLAQMEVMRRLAQGRVAEILGPLAVSIDHQLRGLDVGRAVGAILGTMPDETRGWLDHFVSGINHVVARAPQVPPEFRLLGLAPERWSTEDVVSVGRLASVDLNWIVLFNALRVYGTVQWQTVWSGLMGEVELPDAEDAVRLAASFTHSGSNALAVAGWRTKSGAAIVAGDPHLDLVLPNFWLAGGFRSPSYHLTGLMIPGLPFVALGRNPWIAWTGTSLHAASSDLYDAGELPSTRRDERIRTRWGGDRHLSVRETRLGPVVTHTKPLAGAGRPVALRWMGHRPSDEFTAMLCLNRACCWEDFLAAAARISVPGQTLIYGDTEGHIGKCLAVRLPRRPLGAPADLLAVQGGPDPWTAMVGARELPHSHDPDEGWVVSANLPPKESPIAVAYFHSPPYREERMEELLAAAGTVGVDDIASLQRDVHSRPTLAMRDRFLALLRRNSDREGGLARVLAEWDGDYHCDSQGAVAYERVLYHLLRLLEGRAMRRMLAATWDPGGIVRVRLAAMPEEAAVRIVARAFARASRGFCSRSTWGSVHRLRLPHLFGHLPVLGALFRYGDYPWPGGKETLMKAAHPVSRRRHSVRYGANARFIADLSDLDASQVVLVGGQDGWLGSSTFMDQVELWHQNKAISLPLRVETVRHLYPYLTILVP